MVLGCHSYNHLIPMGLVSFTGLALTIKTGQTYAIAPGNGISSI